DRRADFGIAETDLGDLQLRLGGLALGRKGALRGEGAIDRRLLAGGGLQQVLRALERQLGVAVLRLELLHIGLVGIDLSLERGLLEEVQEVVLLYLRALHKEPLLEKSADPRNQRHPADCLNAADELVGFGDLL